MEATVSRAQAIKNQSRLTLRTGGVEVVIVRPSILTLIKAGVDPIVADVNADPKIRERAIKKQFSGLVKDITKLTPMAAKLLELTMVEPQFWNGPVSECPEDAVTQEDLGNDFIVLATEVMALAAGADVEEAAKTAGTFRVDGDGETGQPSS